MSLIQPVTYRWDKRWLTTRMKMFPLSGAVMSTSRYTGSSRFAATANTPWVADMMLAPMEEENWRPIRSLLLRIRGGRGYVRLYDPACRLPRGMAAGVNRSFPNGYNETIFSDGTMFDDGSGFADGATTARLARNHLRGADEVLLEGLVPDQEISLDHNDNMEIGGYLYSCVDSIRSDAAGKALVPIAPELRTDVVAAGAGIIVKFDHPTSPFVLADPNFDGFDVEGPPMHATMGLRFVEVLP